LGLLGQGLGCTGLSLSGYDVGLMPGKNLFQCGDFQLEGFRFRFPHLRRNERAGGIIRIAESAVEPDAQFTGDFKVFQGGFVFAQKPMGGFVAATSEAMEQLFDFRYQHTALVQFGEEVKLGVGLIIDSQSR